MLSVGRHHLHYPLLLLDLLPVHLQQRSVHVHVQVTMFLASSWLNFLLVMSALFLFSPAARVILVLVWGTHLLPSGPLLWREFTQSWGFSTWRKCVGCSVVCGVQRGHCR
jgi:hypothetical protein